MKSDMGNKEWLDDYSALKQVNPGNPFKVPEGYFDEAARMIVSRARLDEQAPAGAKGFVVPENYFDGLNENIKGILAIEQVSDKENINFTVPENYFENLTQQINARILIDEALGEQEGLIVPPGYFDQLNTAILNKTVNQHEVKRGAVVRKLFANYTFKYAAAACFALIIGTGMYIRQVTDPVYIHDHSFLHEQLSAIPISDIQSYLQDDVDANETQRTVIDEGAPVNDTRLSNALQGYNTDTNNDE